jgi:tRNA dimethylallyltransferase
MSDTPERFLIIIGGATATGKTALAIALAQRYQTAIVSADSRQFFREMTIGTAKPTKEELAAAPHYLIDNLSVAEPYSVGDYERDAMAALDQIFQRSKIALLAGGSGLYVRAVCDGLDSFPEVSDVVRAEVAAGEASGGVEWLRRQVERLDPAWLATADMHNPARMRRVLEVCLSGPEPYSAYLGKERPKRDFAPIYIQLTMSRPELYARIDARVDHMIEAGLEEEARSLIAWQHLPVMRTVGYEEWWPYFEGETDRAYVIEKIKQHSRNYAKRQETWFRKYGEWTVFDPRETEQIFNYVDGCIVP